MDKPLTEKDKKILSAIQDAGPASLTMYRDLAEKAGISTDRLLGILREWKVDGRIRRVGAIVNHFRTGHAFGAMVVWEAALVVRILILL